MTINAANLPPSFHSGLSVGLDPEGYGNPDFCWISIHDKLIWSFAGPIVVVIVVSNSGFVCSFYLGGEEVRMCLPFLFFAQHLLSSCCCSSASFSSHKRLDFDNLLSFLPYPAPPLLAQAPFGPSIACSHAVSLMSVEIRNLSPDPFSGDLMKLCDFIIYIIFFFHALL